VEHDWIHRLTNVLLIRDPREVLASYVRSRERVTLDDIGLRQQVSLYQELAAAGQPPPVIDAADFLRDPEAYLRRLCSLVGVAFDDAMLSWPAGPRDSDGVWGPYWYDRVWKSTGFEPYRERQVTLTEPLERLADECRPLYEGLWSRRWTT
jgi:hypothetical protein